MIPEDPVVGCECQSCDVQSSDCCPDNASATFPYTKFGKLRVGIGMPIYECNKKCKCGLECPNRVVQRGRRV